MWRLFRPKSQQLSFPTSSVGVVQVWSHCWTYLLDEGDRMVHVVTVMARNTTDPLSRLRRTVRYAHVVQIKLNIECTSVGLAHDCPISTGQSSYYCKLTCIKANCTCSSQRKMSIQNDFLLTT